MIKIINILSATIDNAKAIASIDLGDGIVREIAFWPELIAQWGGDPLTLGTPIGDYLVACAQWSSGQYTIAQITLKPHASGVATPIDTRNWAQSWIDQHHVPLPYQAPRPY